MYGSTRRPSLGDGVRLEATVVLEVSKSWPLNTLTLSFPACPNGPETPRSSGVPTHIVRSLDVPHWKIYFSLAHSIVDLPHRLVL